MKEYIFRRSIHFKNIIRHNKKKIIEKSLQQGKNIPTELKWEYEKLKDDIKADDYQLKIQMMPY